MLPGHKVQHNMAKVCGKNRGFKTGTVDNFAAHGRGSNTPLRGNYADGVSLTYGHLNYHIWTFAAASSRFGIVTCSCHNENPEGTTPPSYVRNDYFCDTDYRGESSRRVALWEMNSWTDINKCCSFNSPPWFYRQLQQPTTDDIEMRVCRDQERIDEDIQIQVTEIYVQ